MIREKSCGAVVYTEIDGETHYLIVRMRKGHFGMAKGHVEAGETEAQTAEREIKEETGLTVKVDTNFRRSIMYRPYAGCLKDVIFFVAHSSSTDTVPQQEEISSIRWATYDDALNILTYENDKDVLKHAREYLIRTGAIKK